MAGRVEATIRLSRTTMKSAAPVRTIAARWVRVVIGGGLRDEEGSTVRRPSYLIRSTFGKQSYFRATLAVMSATAQQLSAPRRADLRIEAVFHALSDPVRLQI